MQSPLLDFFEGCLRSKMTFREVLVSAVERGVPLGSLVGHVDFDDWAEIVYKCEDGPRLTDTPVTALKLALRSRTDTSKSCVERGG